MPHSWAFLQTVGNFLWLFGKPKSAIAAAILPGPPSVTLPNNMALHGKVELKQVIPKLINYDYVLLLHA